MKLQPIVPWWLVAGYLVAMTALAGWLYWRYRKSSKKKPFNLKRFTRLRGRQIALVLLPALIALGPSMQGGTSSPGMSNLDVIFAVDTTPSMGALDYAGQKQRIDGVKNDLLALSSLLAGAHLEIISFGSEASVILPYSNDLTAFTSAVNTMEPQASGYSLGSSVDKPIGLLKSELQASQSAFPSRYRLVFYLGDGEQTASSSPKTFAPDSKFIDGGAVLGYGTTRGAHMIDYTGLTGSSAPRTYITTFDGSSKNPVPATSKMSPSTLKSIASQLKVSYLDRNQGGAADDVYQASKAGLAVDKSQRVVHYLNLYWLLAVPYVILIFWEWQLLISKLLEIRRKKVPHA